MKRKIADRNKPLFLRHNDENNSHNKMHCNGSDKRPENTTLEVKYYFFLNVLTLTIRLSINIYSCGSFQISAFSFSLLD